MPAVPKSVPAVAVPLEVVQVTVAAAVAGPIRLAVMVTVPPVSFTL